MLQAARRSLGDDWGEARDYARTAFNNLARTLQMIERLMRRGKVTRQQARILLEIQKNTTRTVLLTVEGLGVVAAERAIDAALDAARDVVNRALGWKLV